MGSHVMFPIYSPTFSKLKCPGLPNNCPFGPQNCCFSHDSGVYIKGGLDGRIGLSSLTYYKDLHQRIRTEEAACKESKLFPSNSKETSPNSDKRNNLTDEDHKLSKAMEKDLENFLHRPPNGCKISVNLRQKVLLKLIKEMRRWNAASSLSQAAEIEFEFLMKSEAKISSVYLSGIGDYLKRKQEEADNLTSSSSEAKVDLNDNDNKEALYEKLKGLLADKASLEEYNYPLKCEGDSSGSSGDGDDCNSINTDIARNCRRCGITFNPIKYYATYPVSPSHCRYHSGKVEKIGGLRVYGCCQAPIGDSNGCETFDWHVFEGYKRGDPSPIYSPLNREESSKMRGRGVGVVALDAEMFYTVGGYEASRLTIVDFHTESTLLDVLIKPRAPPVLDYNTKWSGVSAELYETDGGELEVLEFEEVKGRMKEIIDWDTILIGHSLDNDLRVLEFSHEFILDTAILFPHKSGPPYRMSLKSLALGHLSELVQQSLTGHDSREDCVTCVRLVKKYLN